MDKIHRPVLLNEAIDGLNIKPSGFYIDCTLGDGGHSKKILSQLSSQGLLLSIDQDQHSIDFVKKYYEIPNNWLIVNDNFVNIKEIVKTIETNRKPLGILMDLGISSRQIEEKKGRGFSFQEKDQPLDMRMDTTLQVTALDLLKVLNEYELVKLFKTYGEEKHAKAIAKEIKDNISEISTVGDLTSLIYNVVPVAKSNKDPSRRVFQALRIAVNDELNTLNEGLDNAFEILKTDGRLVVISFHSLEDRIVKDFIIKKVKSNEGENITKKPILPTEEELKGNPRASSAKLRILKKLK